MAWSFSAGDKPYTVRVAERKDGGAIYSYEWDGSAEKWIIKSLGHRDKARARKYARERAQAREEGEAPAQATLGQVIKAYLEHRTPRKGINAQKADHRAATLWLRTYGSKIDPHTVSLGKWEGCIDARLCGAIDAKGLPVKEGKRRPVRARSVESDCVFLHSVFNWAVKWRDENGRYLMKENPVRGFPIPREKNPRRPVATDDRFDAVRAVADQVTMERRWRGKREVFPSYLPEILDIIDATGRRISAVVNLRFADLRLHEGRHGVIRFRADTDKMGYESFAPLSPQARAAIDRIMRDRPGIGDAYLFPSPEDVTKPIRRHLADVWLRKAEKLAGLEPQEGSLWHAYRRRWATTRKGLPVQDVAKVGGWKSFEALQTCYQHADMDTMLAVVMGAAPLREVRQ